ncbi:MAG: hypothetical protein FDW93_03055 [Bergeyella sp.]|nr:hypothetical protein [Bergeyella sp.]
MPGTTNFLVVFHSLALSGGISIRNQREIIGIWKRNIFDIAGNYSGGENNKEVCKRLSHANVQVIEGPIIGRKKTWKKLLSALLVQGVSSVWSVSARK